MKKWKRREFLRNVALAGLFAPVARFWPDLAEAQDLANKQNLVLIFFPNGKCAENTFIQNSGSGWNFGPGFSPFEAIRQDLIALENYSFNAFRGRHYSGDHGGHVGCAPIMFSGDVAHVESGKGVALRAPSLDQIIAHDYYQRGVIQNKLRATLPILMKGSSFRHRSLFAQTPSGYEINQDVAGKMASVQMLEDPRAGWDRMFGDLAVASSGNTLEELRAFGKSVLDAPHQEMKSLQTTLPQAGRHILEEHLESLRELEKGLGDDMLVDSGEPPPRPGTIDLTPANHEVVFSAWVKIIDAAFRFDRTRIATLQFGGCASRFQIPSLGLGYVGESNDSNSGSDHHSYTHWKPNDVDHFLKWYSERAVELAQTLKGTDSGLPNLLHDSAIMTGWEFGNNHSSVDIPSVIIGQAGGYFSTGRKVEGGRGIDNMHKHMGTLTALAHAMGSTTISRVGRVDAEYQKGPWELLRG